MKVSVIIPVYNVKQYLQRCVDSVSSQTYTDLEIVLVDDGSTDDSGKLCDELAEADSRIKVIHQSNGGLSDARNAGLRLATGDYVTFLDADDIWLLVNGLENMVDMSENSSADLLLFKRVDIYGNRQTMERDYDTQYIASHTAREVFRHLVLSQRFNMSACFQLIRRNLLVENCLWFPVGMLSEDVDWSLRLWQKVQTVLAVNMDMYGYWHRKGSITSTYSIRNLRCYDEMFRIWGEKIAQPDCINREAIGAFLANLYVSCLYAYQLIDSADRAEARQILHRHASLLKYAASPKSQRAKRLDMVLGETGMRVVMSIYGKLKRRFGK